MSRVTKSFSTATDLPDLVCFSHLRWNFVFQRPQHLLTRFAADRRVFFVEEPVFGNDATVRFEVTTPQRGVHVVVPHYPAGLVAEEVALAQRALVDDLFFEFGIGEYVLWYYTPLALEFSRHLKPRVTVYDCMDELSAFKNAPPMLRAFEAELLERADLVFTGGRSLYEAKRDRHPRVFEFPSSVDVAHFARARFVHDAPYDQASIPRPRLGYFGVVDERMDLALLEGVARLRPDWHLVVIGPVVKIDPESLPRFDNVHYLGMRPYDELPAYLAGWDVAMMPFARNDATRFISPTKTPEYLAAGRPVVSTSIRDVVRPYGEKGLVEIADTPEDFVAAAERFLDGEPAETWFASVDAFLARMSWDATFARMQALVDEADAKGRLAENARAAEAQVVRAPFGRLRVVPAVDSKAPAGQP
jgi:UDP-galactopyranose mutase